MSRRKDSESDKTLVLKGNGIIILDAWPFLAYLAINESPNQ